MEWKKATQPFLSFIAIPKHRPPRRSLSWVQIFTRVTTFWEMESPSERSIQVWPSAAMVHFLSNDRSAHSSIRQSSMEFFSFMGRVSRLIILLCGDELPPLRSNQEKCAKSRFSPNIKNPFISRWKLKWAKVVILVKKFKFYLDDKRSDFPPFFTNSVKMESK